MNNPISLQPGIYTNGTRPARTLIAVNGGTCIYTFDDPRPLLNSLRNGGTASNARISVTTCSGLTFVKAMNAKPATPLTAGETQSLADRMISALPYRRSNRRQRALFFPHSSRCKIRDNAEAKKTQAPVKQMMRRAADERLLKTVVRQVALQANAQQERRNWVLNRVVKHVRNVLRWMPRRHNVQRAAA